MAQLPEVPATERLALAQQFSFTREAFPQLAGRSTRTIRPVNPSLEPISAWISSVGAAVALGDVDRDGLPNDACYVDVRTDEVLIAPVPGTQQRYAPFELDPGTELYVRDTMAPMGCLLNDVNEDGLMDAVVYYWGRTPVAFLRTAEPAQQSAFMPQVLAPGGERWFTNTATFADMDGDGHLDLVVGNYFADNARILDVTADTKESMQYSMSRAFNGGTNRLLLWAGASSAPAPSVGFQDAGDMFGEEVARGWTLAVGAADLDGDMLPELYFANDFGPDRLLHNRSAPGHPAFALVQGVRTPTMPKSRTLGWDSFKGMGVDFADVNGDGRLDIGVSNITSEFALQESNFLFLSEGDVRKFDRGEAPYVDHSESLGVARSGWGWDYRFGDFNNSGRLEILQATGFVKGTVNRWAELQELAIANDELLANPGVWPRFQSGVDLSGHQHNPFFVQAEQGRFVDLAPELGLDTDEVSRGIATADVNGDGRLDFVVANQWEPSYSYINRAPHPGQFVGLHLLLATDGSGFSVQGGHAGGRLQGSPAVGATAVLTLPDGSIRTGQVDGGNGHSGKRSPDLHFGLGDIDASAPLTVDVSWRGRNGQLHNQTFPVQPGWHTVLLNR